MQDFDPQKLTLTQMVEVINVWRDDALFDLSSEWIEEADARTMQVQLNMLNQIAGTLSALQSQPDSQIFKSSIPF